MELLLFLVILTHEQASADGSSAVPLAVALALDVVRVALAAGEVLGAAHAGAVAVAEAGALELVALRLARPGLHRLRRPHLCNHHQR
jgi:hypothetical protein